MNRNLSIYLDLVRFLTALMVFVVHANYQRFTGGLPFLWRFKDLGNDAVMVFFVLSGFVIAHVVTTKERTLTEYAASRLARLYSVVVPALILTITLDAAGSVFDPSLYSGRWYEYDQPLQRVLAGLTFTNELWFSYTRPFSNGPFWSLGYEPWYYALFAAAHFLRGHVRYVAVTVVCLVIGPKILLLMPVWLLGVWAYRETTRSRLGAGQGLTLMIGSAALYLVFRLNDGPDHLLELSREWLGTDILYDKLAWSRKFLSSYLIGICVALHFIGASALAPHLRRLPGLLERPIRFAAGLTFSLYLLHYPLLQFFAALTPVAGMQEYRAAFVAGGVLTAVCLVGTAIERQKGPLKELLLTWFEGRRQPVLRPR
ncbi:acyltransferase family protein [Ideonella sp. YS5]|uniref:acyltransferase family protein n=1 Tax=Ideonella sp. YS5 TaxID=3453714 RepID=UPI003EE93324